MSQNNTKNVQPKPAFPMSILGSEESEDADISDTDDEGKNDDIHSGDEAWNVSSLLIHLKNMNFR